MIPSSGNWADWNRKEFLTKEMKDSLRYADYEPENTPPPSNYFAYDESGNLSGSVEWDAGRNAYVYHEGGLTPEQKEQRSKRSTLLSQTLSKLSSPEAYAEYAEAYRKEAQGYVDEELNNQARLSNEEMNRKGMTGSTAWSDDRKNIMDTRRKAYTDIANKSIMAKNELFNQDMGTVSSLYGMENQDFSNSLNRQNLYINAALGTTGARTAATKAYNDARQAKYATMSKRYTDEIAGAASALPW